VEVWDLAPLRLIVEEAGGAFFALDGSRRIDRRSGIACAPGLVTQVREAFGIRVE
jgi:fructose-1,6-bisphosphatase/inositol monophosphatase family enzyme